jgi:ADP-ribose diphosphatase
MAVDKKLPEVLKTHSLAKTRLFHIEQMDLRFSNGVEISYERLCSSGNGAVLVVPMLDDNTVLLIREYAGGVQRYELALPKGKLEHGEDPLQGANREIKEEIGYGARDLQYLTSLSIAPGYLSHETQIILARDLFEERIEGDEPEEIEVIPWSLDRLAELTQHPECTEARSIAALYMVRDLLRG